MSEALRCPFPRPPAAVIWREITRKRRGASIIGESDRAQLRALRAAARAFD